MQGNLVADYLEFEDFRYPFSDNPQYDGSAFGASKTFHNGFATHLYSRYDSVIDKYNAIACQDTYFF